MIWGWRRVLAGELAEASGRLVLHMRMYLARQVGGVLEQLQIDSAARARLARLRDDHPTRRLHLLRLREQVERRRAAQKVDDGARDPQLRLLLSGDSEGEGENEGEGEGEGGGEG